VGKTQLALEYCHRYRDDYDMIGWLRADEEPALAADMVQLGREVGLPVDQTTDQAAQVALVRRWLEGSGVHWLLVFDNADTIAPKVLQTYLPRTGQGRVLITSRNPNWRGTAWVLAVNVFAPDEAVAFLLARSAYFSALKPTEVVTTNEEARLLAGALGYLPLALEHAGAYVEAAGCTLAEYRRLLAAQRARLWEKAEAPDAYHATITTTWELSFQQVRTQNPAAIALFNLCCFLAPEEIPLPLLREHRAALPEELAALLADELALNEAIGELRRYSLLARDGDTLAVHRLVQTMARDQMRQERAKIWAEAAVNLMIAALPDNWTHLHEWVDGPQLLPHMMTVNDLASKIAPVKSVADLCTWTGYYLQFRGVYLSARPYYERALAIVEKALGPDHPDTARSLNNLGYLLQAMGNLAEARPYYERALAIREKALGPDHPDTALSLNNLGYLLQAEGDLVDAHDYLERAYKIFAQKLGDGHPNTQVVKENLAAVAARLERGGQGWVGGMARLPAAPHPSC
jgi:tetratricopeptide (TPR) repeat protein